MRLAGTMVGSTLTLPTRRRGIHRPVHAKLWLMKYLPALMMALLLPACTSSGGGEHAALSAAQCQSRAEALQAQADAAWMATGPARDAYRNNPTSFEAKTAVELALQRAARIAAASAQASAELAAGPCKGKLPD